MNSATVRSGVALQPLFVAGVAPSSMLGSEVTKPFAKDWADAVLPATAMQKGWQNELPFSKELYDAVEHRGVLTDEKTKKRLIRESEARRKEQAADAGEAAR